MIIEDYIIKTQNSTGKKCTIYDSLGNIYSGVYCGEVFNDANKELSLSLRLDDITKEKFKYCCIEKNKHGDIDITILISSIVELIFE